MAGFMTLAPFQARAQERDTVSVDTTVRRHTPRKAILYSAICPGLGQVYNRKYWKLPIIYGAGGAFVYYFRFYQLKYTKFREANDKGDTGEVIFIDGAPYDFDDLARGRDWYRRYRDLNVLGMAAIYFLNIIDAMVDAHFFYFDVSDDLSMRLEPAIIENPGMTASVGFRINLGF